jgi:hypothetical protein
MGLLIAIPIFGINRWTQSTIVAQRCLGGYPALRAVVAWDSVPTVKPRETTSGQSPNLRKNEFARKSGYRRSVFFQFDNVDIFLDPPLRFRFVRSQMIDQ